MSGAEAVGLALSAVPLLISAWQTYNECYRPLVKYRNFTKEVDRFRKLFGIQRVLFRSKCLALLGLVVGFDNASSMLNASDHELWRLRGLGKQVSELLNEHAQACMDTVELIDECVLKILNRSRKLWDELDRDSNVRGNADITKIGGIARWKDGIAQRLKYTFSKPHLDADLSQLTKLNTIFRDLCDEALRSRAVNERATVSETASAHVDNKLCKAVNEASTNIYQGLCTACKQHDKHRVLFCTEFGQSESHPLIKTVTEFRLALKAPEAKLVDQQADFLWLSLKLISEQDQTNVPGTSQVGSDVRNALCSSLQQRLEFSPTVPERPTKRPRLEPEQSSLANCASHHQAIQGDICNLLPMFLAQRHRNRTCLGLLGNPGDQPIHLYILPYESQRIQRQTVSLKQLITEHKDQNCTNRVLLLDRLCLAKKLAAAVLYFYSTPWLSANWGCDDICFVGMEDTKPPRLTPPHFNVTVTKSKYTIQSAAHQDLSEKLLFRLGVMLLEIARFSIIEELQPQTKDAIDQGQTKESESPNISAARRLCRSEQTDMGMKYQEVVETLIEGRIGRHTNLNEPDTQVAFQREIVGKLDALEQQLRDFHFGK